MYIRFFRAMHITDLNMPHVNIKILQKHKTYFGVHYTSQKLANQRLKAREEEKGRDVEMDWRR